MQIRKYLPQGIRKTARLFVNGIELRKEFSADRRAYRQYASHADPQYTHNTTEAQLETQITKDYHRIEKGLSLSNPKRPFGLEVTRRLEDLLPVAIAINQDAPHIRYAKDALDALETWNASGDITESISPVFEESRNSFSREALAEFFSSRKSVRNFAPQAPGRDQLNEAIRLASHTPSVCNRQAARVHLYTDPDKIASVLEHQNGNAGFRREVPAVAIITVDKRLFAGKAERNQRWIDGGLFAMSFVWALHGLGLASCMLNWSMTNQQTEALREAASIPPWEDVIVFVACGTPATAHRYARSPRRPLNEISTYH